MRSYCFAIFLGFVLAAATLQAQRMTGGAPGTSPNGNGHGTIPGNGLTRPHGHHHHGSKDGAIWLPYGYWDDGDDSDSDYVEEAQPDIAAPETSRRVVVTTSQRPTAPPPQSPKLVEIPLSSESAASKPQAPAVFVMSSGDRLESRHYVLTSEFLRVEVGRRQLTIPIRALDVPATIAANQERGIDMVIPRDHSSLFLGF